MEIAIGPIKGNGLSEPGLSEPGLSEPGLSEPGQHRVASVGKTVEAYDLVE